MVDPRSGSYDMPTIRGIFSKSIPIWIGILIGSYSRDYFNKTGKYPFYFLFPKSRERVAQREQQTEQQRLQEERSPVA